MSFRAYDGRIQSALYRRSEFPLDHHDPFCYYVRIMSVFRSPMLSFCYCFSCFSFFSTILPFAIISQFAIRIQYDSRIQFAFYQSPIYALFSSISSPAFFTPAQDTSPEAQHVFSSIYSMHTLRFIPQFALPNRIYRHSPIST